MALPDYTSRANSYTVDPSILHDLVDLPEDSPCTPDDVLQLLRNRVQEGLLYTQISPRVIISLNSHDPVLTNPYETQSLTSNTELLQYTKEYADMGSPGLRETLAPHVWMAASRAYYYMRRTLQDQAICFLGQSGSGKTENERLVIKALIDLSIAPHGKKGYRLAQMVPAAKYILETFGNASTTTHDNSSRFGSYSELQFSDRGRLIGLKGLEYNLEKTRVTKVSAGERNFHAFYALLDGASAEERDLLFLNEVTTFRYLGQLKYNPYDSTDKTRFELLRQAFQQLSFQKKAVSGTMRVLAAILHLGNIQFGFDKNQSMDSAIITNIRQAEIVAELLGTEVNDVVNVLTSKTVPTNGEMCSFFLDSEAAAQNRDSLARALYSLLFSWISDYLNEKLCKDDFSTYISVVNMSSISFGSSNQHEGASLETLCTNLISERLYGFTLEQLHEANKPDYVADEITNKLSGFETPYASNQETLDLYLSRPGGLIHIIDDQSHRGRKTDATMLRAMRQRWDGSKVYLARERNEALGRPDSFMVTHWEGVVMYSTENFLSDNIASVPVNFISLLAGDVPSTGVDGSTTRAARDQLSTGGSSSSFIRQLFMTEALNEQFQNIRNSRAFISGETPPGNTLYAANHRQAPHRGPSIRRPKKSGDADNKDNAASNQFSVIKDLDSSITTLIESLKETRTWFVFSMRTNDTQTPQHVDSRIMLHQIHSMGVVPLISRLRGEWAVNLEFKEWWERYKDIELFKDHIQFLSPLVYKDKPAKCQEILKWSDSEMAIGKNRVFLSYAAFRLFEDYLRVTDANEQTLVGDRLKTSPADREVSLAACDTYSPSGITTSLRVHVDSQSYYDGGDGQGQDTYDGRNALGGFRNGGDNASGRGVRNSTWEGAAAPEEIGTKEEEDIGPSTTVEEIKSTRARKMWVCLTWSFTWWIPSVCLSYIGRMKRKDVRMAWREKLLINMIIWFMCGCSIFIIAVFPNLICPKQHVYNQAELSDASYTNDPDNMRIAIRGEVFDLTKFAPLHQPGSTVIPTRTIKRYGGTDVTELFPVQVSALCNGVDGSVSPWVTLDNSNSSVAAVAQYHDFRAYTGDVRPDWYTEMMIYMRYNYRKGFRGYTKSNIKTKVDSGSKMAIINDEVYDMSTYITNNGGGIRVPDGETAPSDVDRQFMSSAIVELFSSKAGSDITSYLDRLNLDADTLARQKVCLRNLFFVGKVDNRNSTKCVFSRYILLALSLIMVCVIGFKFIAALQFGRARKPENYDKFVILQVPCYTEGEESLKECIDSLTKLKYDDKRKLIVVICDGMIVGSGNDRPTPQIVLDILGSDPALDPEPLSFLSVGTGSKQHNRAKVYSGLYEAGGHIVPYLVIAKVGAPTEKSRPGNRGKRDSQMLLMRFLNRVHFGSPMAPCELEMYHQIKNVIGVNPSFYEYILMVDADTVVSPFSLNYLVGACVADRKIIGICGETSLSNARQSWTTMLQVYEYYISHYLAKAFESLFSTVTCLPGCFSLYRIRTVDHKPVIVANPIIEGYGENRIETLHMKNLLSLGEDRYLSTLMLKNFGEYKTKFCSPAKAQTIAPDDIKVLMSQRRRWINSTVHNLFELMSIRKLCGFCCFSMRFIVLIDLISTLIQPVTVAYIVYLIYYVVAEHNPVPTTALILLGVIYGLQALIFILHRKFEHVGWMILYLIAIPFFSLILPVVSFWQMDNFSWGSTREIVGEKGKRLIIHDEGAFDPNCIPLKTWEEFENELWEQGSNESIGSMLASREYDPYDGAPDDSVLYGSSHSRLGFSASRDENIGLLHHPMDERASFYAMNAPSVYSMNRQNLNVGMSSATPSYLSPYYTGYGAPSVRSASVHNYSFAQPQSNLPSSETIEADVRVILSHSNYETITKKDIRIQLEQKYGCDLSQYRSLISEVIDQSLGL